MWRTHTTQLRSDDTTGQVGLPTRSCRPYQGAFLRRHFSTPSTVRNTLNTRSKIENRWGIPRFRVELRIGFLFIFLVGPHLMHHPLRRRCTPVVQEVRYRGASAAIPGGRSRLLGGSKSYRVLALSRSIAPLGFSRPADNGKCITSPFHPSNANFQIHLSPAPISPHFMKCGENDAEGGWLNAPPYGRKRAGPV